MSNEATGRSLRWLPFFVAASGAVLGMHLFPFVPNIVNLPWEFFYGLGYYVAGFVLHPYVYNPRITFIGLLLWPLLATFLVFLVARIAVRSSRVWRIVAAVVFAASVLFWISDSRANEIARRWPIFTNYYFVNF